MLLLSEKVRKNTSIYRNPDEEFSPFEFRFFIARARHNSTVQYHQELPDEVNTWIYTRIYVNFTIDIIRFTLPVFMIMTNSSFRIW